MSSGTTIIRARVEPQGLDPYAVQQRLQRSLSAMTLHPTGLPPQSIVCIRHLRSTARLWHAQVALPQLQAQIDACVVNAVRPAHGFVPAHANVVVFTDEAEQLVCLTRDWLRGVVRQQWWWSFLLLKGGVDEVLYTAWLHAPVQGPAALAQLAVGDEAVPFLNRLPDGVVLNMLQRVMVMFGLHDLESVVLPRFSTTGSMMHVDLLSEDAGSGGQVSNPWRYWLTDSVVRSLSPAAACLLGMSVGLQRHAAQVRIPEFAQEVLTWLKTTMNAHASIVAPGIVSRDEPVANRSNDVTTIAPAMNPDQPALSMSTQFSSQAVTDRPALPTLPTLIKSLSTDSRDKDISIASPMTGTDAISTQMPLQNFEDTMNLSTEFGGVFYLVNIMLNLGWYADFTQPLRRGLDQNLYDMLAWIGEHTLGERFRADAIRVLLKRLAGWDALIEPDYRPTEAWLTEQIGTLQHRLAQALGETSAGDWIAFVCAHPARIATTATRLDVFLSLENLPIPIRLSGLDRDPGWVPAAGRFIAFHFD